MSIENSDFLSFAEEILKPSCDEVFIRSAASRAYYCIFHQISSIVGNIPKLDSDGNKINAGIHLCLIKYLEGNAYQDLSLDKKTLCKLARSMKWTKQVREDSDYYLNKNITLLKAKQIITEAHNVVNLVSGLKK
ncbi:hypothetical protein AAD041_06410 [Proteus mirabilis]|uniref:hypothetical protein n=1 Tax=Proteus mirabilis TaxID=584 RepID=UPI0038A60082